MFLKLWNRTNIIQNLQQSISIPDILKNSNRTLFLIIFPRKSFNISIPLFLNPLLFIFSKICQNINSKLFIYLFIFFLKLFINTWHWRHCLSIIFTLITQYFFTVLFLYFKLIHFWRQIHIFLLFLTFWFIRRILFCLFF